MSYWPPNALLKMGPAVYKARALFENLIGMPALFNDNGCDTLGYSARPGRTNENGENTEAELISKLAVKETQQIKKRSKVDYKVFPNPAKDEVSIVSKTESEQLKIEIRNVNNRILKSLSVKTSGFIVNLDLDLLNGVCFVSIKATNNEADIKKLVISK